MTYRQLLAELNKLPADRLDDTVTSYDLNQDEFTAIVAWGVSEPNNDVLDPGHLFLVTKS